MTDIIEEGRQQLAAVVANEAASIKEVISTLAQVKAAAEVIDPRGQEDGIACFTQLYYEITCGVQAAVDAHRFTAGDFIVHLDLAFARRYLAALRALTTDGARPAGCWQALFYSSLGAQRSHAELRDGRSERPRQLRPGHGPAHDTWEQNPAPASTDANDTALREAQHTDYNTINDIFDENMGRLRGEFHSPLSALGRAVSWTSSATSWVTYWSATPATSPGTPHRRMEIPQQRRLSEPPRQRGTPARPVGHAPR